MAKTGKPCAIEGCEYEAGPRSTICKRCRANHYYWASKRPAQRLLRRAKLAYWSSRWDTWFKVRDGGEK